MSNEVSAIRQDAHPTAYAYWLFTLLQDRDRRQTHSHFPDLIKTVVVIIPSGLN